jgi:hypothetical protein
MAEYNEENTKWGKTGQTIRKVADSGPVRALSGALMKSAFRDFGKAFDGGGYTPRGMRPDESYLDSWEEAGGKAAQALEDRWHKAEFENFRKNHLNQFQEFQQNLLDKYEGITNGLKEGVWEHPDGKVEEFDFSNPQHVAKMNRLKGQIEQEAVTAMTEAQIDLNMTAGEKYANNPIVDGLIQKMMEGQMNQLASQFQTPMTNQQEAHDMKMRTGLADVNYKQSLTEEAKTRTGQISGDYTSADSVIRDKGPNGAVRYWINDVKGQAMWQQLGGPGFEDKVKQLAADKFIKNKKWTPEQAAMPGNQEIVDNYLASIQPRVKERAMYRWLEQEHGKDVANQAAEGRPDMLADPVEPMVYDVKTNPGKKDTKEKTDAWEALAREFAHEEMRKDRSMTKEEAKEWMLEEFLPAALEGETVDGQYLPQTDGLTADEMNKAAAPYIKAVRAALEEAAKWLGYGEGTEGMPEHQQTRRGGGPAKRRAGAVGRLGSVLIDKVTPDAILPKQGKGLYPQKFRKHFPKEEPKE